MNLAIWKKTSKDRNCLLKIDNSVWGTMSEKTLRTLFHYHVGNFAISESEAVFLKDELLRTAWNSLVNWLARQERSTFESREYLAKKLFHASIVDRCLQEAISKNFIDDERYCRLLIESLIRRSKSAQQIKTKLLEKRLSAVMWEPILAELYIPAEEKDVLREQAEKTYLRFRHLEPKACYEKCLASLFRKGFDLDEARQAVARLVYPKS
jgi:SOS response regulatory protein OraA/RecX